MAPDQFPGIGREEYKGKFIMGPLAPLKIFPDRESAQAAINKSRSKRTLRIVNLDRGGHYVKMEIPGAMPKYLCADGCWSKYGHIPDIEILLHLESPLE